MNLSNKMKIKKDKKRSKDADVTEEPISSEKPQKKVKLSKDKPSDPNEGDAENSLTVPVQAIDKSLKSVDSNIFKFFKDLTSDEESTRMEAALHLVQQLSRTKDESKREKELSYTLKRLIRGCGASTNVSRSGFFTGLVGLLKAFSVDEVSMQLVLDTLNKELNVGAAVANKEDADGVVGKILVVGALLHSGRLLVANEEYIEQVTNMLLQSTRHRTYHASLGYSFLCEIIETLPQKQFESSMWPLLQSELTKPWPKQNLQTVFCLITIQRKYPNLVNAKFMKTHFGGPELLNPESFQALHKIFWEHSNTDILTHPAFESFGSYVASSKYLTQFWKEFVDAGLANPTKLLEIETLKILTDILDNLNVEQTKANELLSDNFMRMFVEGLKNLKQKKDETLKAFYADFLEALAKCCSKITKDVDKVSIIKRLILPPGIFNIEKFSNNRIVHQLINSLGEEGVKDMFKLYKSIFLGTLTKNPDNSSENWLNFEKLNAGYMLQHLLQHKAVNGAYKWREEQLQFLLTCGVFYVTDTAEICKKDVAGTFSKDFADQCKNMFYTCLQTKLSDIHEEQQLLFNLASFCQEKLMQKHVTKYLRVTKFEEGLQKSWRLMFEAVSEGQKHSSQEMPSKNKKSSDKKLQNVFNILLLTMGLQLFREPEMAGPAIEDLLKCLQKTKEQSKNKKKSKHSKSQDTAADENEPEWIEVVVDLFLHLLSQNNSALRNIVNALFPHVCANLSLTAVHQILTMLDMKDGQNPLSSKDEDDDEEDEEEGEEEEENDVVKADVNGKASDEEEASSDENDDDDEDDEEEEDDDDDDEEEDADEEDGDEAVTAGDKLRNAISQALMATGAAPAADDDMESVDLNDMTEEEGHKLDEALANAFKALKKTSGNAQSKKSKSYRVKTTTVMHFRIRVLDLLEIYLQQNPSLLISIEIMLALFNMLEYCVGEELKPLQTKVEKTLIKLTAGKNYTIAEEELKEDNFVDFLRIVAEKKAPAPVYEIVNRMRNKCFCFLITHGSKCTKDKAASTKILSLCQEYTQEFIKSRNPIINVTLISEIFKLRWSQIWNLAEDLTLQGINQEARTFRRIQIYEILSILYKNYELQKQDETACKKHFKKIEKILLKHIKEISENASNKHSPKEFVTLLELVINAQKAHQRYGQKSALTDEETLTAIQHLRKLIRLESTHVYQRFCGTFKLQIVRNTEVHQNDKTTTEANEAETDSESEMHGKKSKSHVGRDAEQKVDVVEAGKKRKQTAKDLRKLKKQKKQQRLEAASRGLNGGIGFTQKNGSRKKADSAEDDDSDSS